MGRLLAVVLVLASLGVFLVLHEQGVDRAFGGALARLMKRSTAASAAPELERRSAQDGWERGEGTRPPGVAQGVRERVSRAMETGAKRHGGG
jgi:hypothetical protein